MRMNKIRTPNLINQNAEVERERKDECSMFLKTNVWTNFDKKDETGTTTSF